MNKPHTSSLLAPAFRRAKCLSVRGVTLIEMLTVVALAAIISGAAVPYMGKLIDSVRIRTIASDFHLSLYLARSEASKHKTRAVVCKSGDGVSCAATGGWEQGWIVFHDADNDGTVDAGEHVIQSVQALPSGFSFAGNLNVDRYISFTPTGTTRTVGGAFQAGTIRLCKRSAGNIEGRDIVINNMGRARIVKVSVPTCP